MSGASRRRAKRERLGVSKSGSKRRTGRETLAKASDAAVKRGLIKCALGTPSKTLNAIEVGIFATKKHKIYTDGGRWSKCIPNRAYIERTGIKVVHIRTDKHEGRTDRYWTDAGRAVVMHA